MFNLLSRLKRNKNNKEKQSIRKKELAEAFSPVSGFPYDGSKKAIVVWAVDNLWRERCDAIKDRNFWRTAFIGQLIFWVTLFTTGKVWLGWFPI